jgi:hypothetical protein
MSETIDELAVGTGRWIALETMLFETLGEWARSDDVPAPARRVLATWCHRHAWHAELWRERMPVIAHHELPTHDAAPDFVAPTRAAIEADVNAIAEPVLTSMQDRVDAHLARIDPLLDGPTARILALVAADLATEVSELRAVLGGPPAS